MSESDPEGFDPRERWDPLHSYSAPNLHWTRSNVGEAMPGVQTPLSWTLWSHGIELAPREALYAVGALTRAEREVPDDHSERFLRVFMGRAAMQVDFLASLGDRMPGTTGPETAAAICGSVPDDIVYEPSRRRYPVVAWRLPLAFATTPRRVRDVAASTEAWYRETIGHAPGLDLAGAVALFADAKERFDLALTVQSIALIAVVQPLFEALGDLVEKAGVGDVSTLSGSGGAELAIVSDIWKAARGELELEQVIVRHGFHGPLEGELSSRVWREDDAPLRGLLERYADRADPIRPDEDRRRADMQSRVIAALPARQRPAARVVLRLAETRILLRGVAKRSFLQAVDVARATARRAGELLAADGALDGADDVFFLTYDELTGSLPADVKEVVIRRRERHGEYQAVELPENWKGIPVATPRDAPDRDRAGGDAADDEVTGTGVSGGVVEGLVRVVTDPAFDEVEPDEILVAPTTDPSWSSIMFVSAGLVVDIGGALSHAAVVAREMGIPCVVSTGSGSRVLRTGDRVRVDGSAGVVTVLERAQARPARA